MLLLKKIGAIFKHLIKSYLSFIVPLIFVVTLIISKLLLSLWCGYLGVMHTSFELACIFMEFGSFLIFWLTYNINEFPSKNVLTFGFLCISIFDLLHVISFSQLNIFEAMDYDLSVKYSMMGRFVEVIVLFMMSIDFKNSYNSKRISLCITLLISLGGAYLVYLFPGLTPRLFNQDTGVTIFKVGVEYAIIFLLIISVLKLRRKVEISNYISYKYVLTGLIFAISSQFCYTLYGSYYSLYYLWGHLLKIIFYCYLFRGLFVTMVIYPYKKIIKLHIESEERYRSAFDNLSSGLVLTDLQGRIIKVNKYLTDILGYSEEELWGVPFGNIIPEGDAFIDGSYAQKLLENNNDKVLLFEGRYLHKAGHDVWVKVNISLANNIKGQPVYFVYEVQDVSSSKKVIELEMGMQKKVEQLKEALEYDKLRTEFFANLSHELRTPLNVITGALQLLEINLKNDANDSTTRNMNFIKQNSRRLIRLVNNIIDTTKFEAGFSQLNLKNYNIVRLVEDITLSIAGYTSLKEIELVFDTDMEEKIIACDPDKIERIMLNLLSNAIKFTEKGGSIYVYISEGDEGVIISIKDTGIGIPKDKQRFVFERFRQMDKSFTRDHEGSGIGLSLVKCLVELHGGKVELLSEPGVGSEFIIYLPHHVINNQEDDSIAADDLERVERVKVEFSDIYMLK